MKCFGIKYSMIFLLSMCLAVSVQASYVLWVGVSENAVVHTGENTFSIPQFANIVGQPMGNMGGRILVDGVAIPAGFEDPNQVADPSLIPAGQTTPSIVWEADFEGKHIGPYTDFGLGVVDNNDNWIGAYSDWQPIYLGEENPATLDVSAIFEIGYWDDNENFIPLASSDSFPLNEMDDHYYLAGTLAPPTETPWRPVDFYTDYPVPEPSSISLFLSGLLILMLSRKRSA